MVCITVESYAGSLHLSDRIRSDMSSLIGLRAILKLVTLFRVMVVYVKYVGENKALANGVAFELST